jgi:SAM-dependent methyltransferase
MVNQADNPFDAARYWEDRLRDSTDLADVGYAGLGEFNAWLYRLRRSVFRRTVAPYLASIRSVIDVGSGSGFYVDRWREAGVPEIKGCDIAAPAVERLRERFPQVEFSQMDIGDPAESLKNWHADALSAFDVTFHIVDDVRYAQALRNMAAMLRDGGLLFFTDNFIEGPTMRQRHHVSRNRSETEAALREAGLEVVSVRPSFVLMNEPVDTNRPRAMNAWSRLERLLRRRPAWGYAVGALLYPFELVALRLVRGPGPSTKIIVTRKPPRVG